MSAATSMMDYAVRCACVSEYHGRHSMRNSLIAYS
jgi:hypothetical protein